MNSSNEEFKTLMKGLILSPTWLALSMLDEFFERYTINITSNENHFDDSIINPPGIS
jgi:hypothetical protein